METPTKWLVYGYMALFALMPWSLDVGFGTWRLGLPSQPIIVVLGLGLVLQFRRHPKLIQALFLKNRFLQISLLYLMWMFVSACFSSDSIVSWKYWMVAAGHWWVFAVGVSAWPMLWQRAFPWFACSILGVAGYTIAHHAFYHFRADQAQLSPMPFFADHTIWAATVVMVLFLLQTVQPFPGWKEQANWNPISALDPKGFQLFKLVGFLLLFLALVLSTCRAAWVSALLVCGVWVFRSLGTKARLLMVLSGLIFCFWGISKLSHYVSQDVSSLERINRWACGFRMLEERPILGFGPGTFQFQYLDFQRTEEMTRISVREAFDHGMPHPIGRGGGAHSEYWRALAETGWPGLLLLLGLLGLVFGKGGTSTPKFPLNLPISLALLSYFIHGLANDFLHDDRIAALVWGCMALLFAPSLSKHALPSE
jgi:putative inorganic carbon (HCO3(-)) transporter